MGQPSHTGEQHESAARGTENTAQTATAEPTTLTGRCVSNRDLEF